LLELFVGELGCALERFVERARCSELELLQRLSEAASAQPMNRGFTVLHVDGRIAPHAKRPLDKFGAVASRFHNLPRDAGEAFGPAAAVDTWVAWYEGHRSNLQPKTCSISRHRATY